MKMVRQVDEEPSWEVRPASRILVEGKGAKIKCIARSDRPTNNPNSKPQNKPMIMFYGNIFKFWKTKS